MTVLRLSKNFGKRQILYNTRENKIQQLVIEIIKVKHGPASEVFEGMFVINNNST